jgi:hypothetical protein
VASPLELVALKVAGPVAAVVLAVAAVAGGEVAGVSVGPAELGGAALALFLLREVFGFIRWHTERKDAKAAPEIVSVEDERLEVQREIVQVLKQQSAILARMDTSQAAVLKITEQYAATGVCPLTRPIEREATIEAIGRSAARHVED